MLLDPFQKQVTNKYSAYIYIVLGNNMVLASSGADLVLNSNNQPSNMITRLYL